MKQPGFLILEAMLAARRKDRSESTEYWCLKSRSGVQLRMVRDLLHEGISSEEVPGMEAQKSVGRSSGRSSAVMIRFVSSGMAGPMMKL